MNGELSGASLNIGKREAIIRKMVMKLKEEWVSIHGKAKEECERVKLQKFKYETQKSDGLRA